MANEDNNSNNALNSSIGKGESLSKFLFKTAKKVGFTVYDMVTDELLETTKKRSIMCESKEDRDTAKSFLDYMTTRITEYEGDYIAEDESMVIRVEKCTTVKMDFIIASKMYPKNIKCTGNFLGESKVLYSGQQCTLTITWCSEDDFILKGKLPWEENEIELYFVSPRLFTMNSDYEGDYVAENDSMVIRVKKCTIAKMDFLITSKVCPEMIDDCCGKFIEEDKVLYSGQQCTLTITWCSEDDFILKGKLPWEENEIELHFISSRVLASMQSYIEENDYKTRVLGNYLFTSHNQGFLLNIEYVDDEYNDFQLIYLSNMRQVVTDPKKVNINVIFHQKGIIETENDIPYVSFISEGYKLIFIWENDDIVNCTKITSEDDEIEMNLKRRETYYIDELIEYLKSRDDR